MSFTPHLLLSIDAFLICLLQRTVGYLRLCQSSRMERFAAIVNNFFPHEVMFERALNVLRWAIWYHLCNLKNVKKTHEGVFIS